MLEKELLLSKKSFFSIKTDFRKSLGLDSMLQIQVTAILSISRRKIALFTTKKGQNIGFYSIFVAVCVLKTVNFGCFSAFRTSSSSSQRLRLFKNVKNCVLR